MSDRKLIELTLIEYEPATFDEGAWRALFDGMEKLSGDPTPEAYLESRSWNAMYCPEMQLEDNPEKLFLLTPIWSDAAWPVI